LLLTLRTTSFYFRPVDIKKMLGKIEDEKYEDLDMLEKDFMLMCSNTQKYNEDGSLIYEDSIVLQTVFTSARTRLEADAASSSKERGDGSASAAGSVVGGDDESSNAGGGGSGSHDVSFEEAGSEGGKSGGKKRSSGGGASKSSRKKKAAKYADSEDEFEAMDE